jgi:hypothetical protein
VLRLAHLVLAACALATAGCAGPGTQAKAIRSTSPSTAPTTPRSPLYAEPVNPCDAVSPATVQRFKLTKPDKTLLPGVDINPATSMPVDYNFVKCSWSIDNLAHGTNGRPNMFTFSITYVVIDQRLATAEQIAKTLYLFQKDKMKTGGKRQVKRAETPDGLGAEAYYTFSVDQTSVGEGAGSDLLIRKANAYVSLSLSGADLRLDPSLPRGRQLVTTPVTEDRLKPTVLGTVQEAMSLLR